MGGGPAANGARAAAAGLTAGGAIAQIQFPTPLPPEYDFRAIVIRNTGNGPLAMIAYENGNPFAWIIGGHNGTVTGFGRLNGQNYDDNDTTHRALAWLSDGVEHTLVLRVRKDSIIAYIDGLPQITLDTNLIGLSLPPDFHKSSSPVAGLWTGGDAVTIKSADIFTVAPKPAASPAPAQ
jgi:hypothetical protein